jgi:hypothetical protein
MNSFELNWRDELAKGFLMSYTRQTGYIPDATKIKEAFDSADLAIKERKERINKFDEPLEISEYK